MPTVIKKQYMEESEAELNDMTREQVTEGMLDKEILFCQYYIGNYNIKMAAIKAGYKASSAALTAYKVRRKYLVNRYIAWLKLQVSHKCFISAMDIVEQYIKAGFADMNDFVEIKNNKIRIHNGEEIDGQLIQEIRQGRDGGITIKLVDKLHALEKLERYFDCMPKDWKQKIEEQKIELLKERLELDKKRMGDLEEELGDDGFLEALKESAKMVWEGEQEDENT